MSAEKSPEQRTSRRPRSAAERAATNPGGRATFFEPTMLCALAIRPAHGYELRHTVEDLTDGLVVMDLPGVYRLLRRFESEGLATAAWSSESAGPRRRVYEITDEGVSLLADWRGFLRRQMHAAELTTAAIDAVLDVWVPAKPAGTNQPAGRSEVTPDDQPAE